MIGIAFLEDRNRIVISVRCEFGNLDITDFLVDCENHPLSISSVQKLDVAKWKNKFGFVKGWDVWEIHLLKQLSLEQLRGVFQIAIQRNGNRVSKKVVLKRGIAHRLLNPQEADFPSCSEIESNFRIFAPFAKKVSLTIYGKGEKFYTPTHDPVWILPLIRQEGGVWSLRLEGNFHGVEYQYLLENDGEIFHTLDPYSLSVSTNSKHSVLIDQSYVHPPGWEEDHRVVTKCYTDMVLYETHIRDFTIDPLTNIEQKGRYLSWCMKEGKSASGLKAGLDHLTELGITHVHLLPVQDFASVDDTHPSDYNWGYDPLCYTVPEGSYTSNPRDAAKKVEEFQRLVQALHREKIGVILDVVYNHVWDAAVFSLSNIFSSAIYRHQIDGTLSNGSGCGNELDSQHPVFRNYFFQTLKYWVEVYHVDGFRFDLMGLIDKETMLRTAERLEELFPGIVLYGEPWTGGDTPLPTEERSLKGFQKGTTIAVFNDTFRNALKGFPDDASTGFVTGNFDKTEEVIKGMAGSIPLKKGVEGDFRNPRESINYDSCHDNLTLYDKIRKSCAVSPTLTIGEEKIFLMQRVKCCHFLITMAQGVPLFHNGEEFCRTKHGQSNSYNTGDLYNAIDWERKGEFIEVNRYLRGLLALRKEYGLLRICTGEEVRKRFCLLGSWREGFYYILKASEVGSAALSAVPADGSVAKASECSLLIGIHLGCSELEVNIPKGFWEIRANRLTAGSDLLGIAQEKLSFPAYSWFFATKRKEGEML